MKLASSIVSLSLSWSTALAQLTDSTHTTPAPATAITVTGYIDAYYVHDLTAPKTTQERPAFLYNFKRNREVNLNLGYIKAAYATERVRANLALQVGTYAQYNYAAEQELLKTVYEANAGIKLSKSRNLWLDAGVFSSHIGFESAVSKDCWTLTRSLVAENSPYYLAGAKLTYSSNNGKWILLGSVVNGWQRIKRLDGYSGPALSTQLQYKPTAALTLNWSTFFGSDRPDSLRQSRMYHNLYAIIQPTGKFGLTLGFDVGSDRKPITKPGTNQRVGKGHYVWYTPIAIARYAVSPKVSMTGRVEFFSDKNGIVVSTGTANGFQTWGYSVNVDYAIAPNVLVRIEGRGFSSKDAIFETTSGLARSNSALTTSLAISF